MVFNMWKSLLNSFSKKYSNDSSFVKSLLHQFGGKIYTLFLSFVISSQIARFLGPSYFGLFSYSVSLALMIRPVWAMGMKEP